MADIPGFKIMMILVAHTSLSFVKANSFGVNDIFQILCYYYKICSFKILVSPMGLMFLRIEQHPNNPLSIFCKVESGTNKTDSK